MQSPIGILLTNLGSPDAPTRQAVRRYLKEFLWDRRVVDLPRPMWWLVLNGIVLNTRPQKSAALYRQIWTSEGSPLLSISKRQATLLFQALNPEGASGPTVHVELAMRYGNPSIADGLTALQARGCDRLLLLPLYPQYACASTASTFDAVAATLQDWRAIPEIRMIRDYHDHPAYITALVESVREFWALHGEPQKVVISFHGLPQRYVAEGDPYGDQCQKTATLLAGELGLSPDYWTLAFQSRFGREAWLPPYTNETLRALGQAGTKRVDLICPGFSADCLETLQENALENRKIFLDAGGQDLRYIPALNDRPEHIACLTDLIRHHLQGWV